MQHNPIVSADEWLAARRQLLREEKEFTRRRDQLTAARRDLPWVQVRRPMRLTRPPARRPSPSCSTAAASSSSITSCSAPAGRKAAECSFVADHFDGMIAHLNARDVSLVAVSRAPLAELDAFRRRMGWSFDWVSSHGTSFNRDFHMSFTEDEIKGGEVYYNFGMTSFRREEAPGASVFYKGASGDIFHTYSCYGRGLDMLIGAYNFLDLTPKGRDERALVSPMASIRHHDRYGDSGSSAGAARDGRGLV